MSEKKEKDLDAYELVEQFREENGVNIQAALDATGISASRYQYWRRKHLDQEPAPTKRKYTKSAKATKEKEPKATKQTNKEPESIEEAEALLNKPAKIPKSAVHHVVVESEPSSRTQNVLQNNVIMLFGSPAQVAKAFQSLLN